MFITMLHGLINYLILNLPLTPKFEIKVGRKAGYTAKGLFRSLLSLNNLSIIVSYA